jgi:hypothetical protein
MSKMRVEPPGRNLAEGNMREGILDGAQLSGVRWRQKGLEGMQVSVEELILQAKQESERRKLEPVQKLQHRRDQIMERLQVAARAYLQDGSSEEDMNLRMGQIQDKVRFVQKARISAADAMVSLVERGVWNREPVWLELRDWNYVQWKGHVEKGRFLKFDLTLLPSAWSNNIQRLKEEDADFEKLLEFCRDINLCIYACRQCSGGLLLYARIDETDESEDGDVDINLHYVYEKKFCTDLISEVKEILPRLLQKVLYWQTGTTFQDLADVVWEHCLVRNLEHSDFLGQD